ncbi:MAG TPA: thiamine pyrophosphate-dependent enzyme, partial [Thermoanaerobaculia bacterium]
MATAAPPIASTTLDAFRRLGYLYADLDPLDRLTPEPEALLGDADPATAEQARRWYCGPIGVEFMHIEDPERQRWVQERMEREPEPARFDRSHILDLLIRADTFEQMIQARYLGTKRFSIEGVESLLPLLDEMLEAACERQARQVVLAMSHRGRLNVMVHTVGVKTSEIFAGFEDVDPRSILGGGDVKYHMGATGDFSGRCGHTVDVHLVSNPSHLEAVDPVAVGRVRAKQTRLEDRKRERVFPIVLHGDAAFAGQGILAETLNFQGLPGYDVGGTIHVVVNNLIGFTTEPKSLHSSRFATAVARRLPVPIFHVNGEEPDAVARVARLAVEFRYTFGSDVIVDLIGYRRHGHSEVDDPTITQPLLYKKIAAHPPIWKLYAKATGVSDEESARRVAAVRQELEEAHQEASRIEKKPTLRTLPPYWVPSPGGRYKAEYEVSTGVPAEEI